jgi:hypothetical protein
VFALAFGVFDIWQVRTAVAGEFGSFLKGVSQVINPGSAGSGKNDIPAAAKMYPAGLCG